MQADRSTELQSLLTHRILILDGAMGTMIQQHRLTEAQYRGDRFAAHPRDLKGNNELLSLTQPQVIRDSIDNLGRLERLRHRCSGERRPGVALLEGR